MGKTSKYTCHAEMREQQYLLKISGFVRIYKIFVQLYDCFITSDIDSIILASRRTDKQHS